MLRWLIRRKLDSEEKKLGESVDYIRQVVDISAAEWGAASFPANTWG